MKTISKYLYVMTFVAFFFPFCTFSCKKAETTEGTATDSVAVEVPVDDTNVVNTLGNKDTLDSIPLSEDSNSTVGVISNLDSIRSDSSNQKVAENDSLPLGDRISKKILLPDGENVSVWGMFYFNYQSFATTVYFVLFVLSGIYRFVNKEERLILVYLGLAILSLFSVKWFWDDGNLIWGYWVIIITSGLNLFVSLISFILERKTAKSVL